MYEGTVGIFPNHASRACSTSGALVWTLTPGAGNTYYLDSLNLEPSPWGGSDGEHVFKDADPNGPQPIEGKARTHYAVDYAPAGKELARFIFLDTSSGSIGTAASPQNPNEPQTAFVQRMITDASPPPTGIHGPSGLPTIIVMNQPTQNPTATSTSIGAKPAVNEATDIETWAQTPTPGTFNFRDTFLARDFAFHITPCKFLEATSN